MRLVLALGPNSRHRTTGGKGFLFVVWFMRRDDTDAGYTVHTAHYIL